MKREGTSWATSAAYGALSATLIFLVSWFFDPPASLLEHAEEWVKNTTAFTFMWRYLPSMMGPPFSWRRFLLYIAALVVMRLAIRHLFSLLPPM